MGDGQVIKNGKPISAKEFGSGLNNGIVFVPSSGVY
jgi:hypothetical protein